MTTTDDQVSPRSTAPTPEEVGAAYDRFGDLYAITTGDVGLHIGLWSHPDERAPAATLTDLANRAQERQTDHHIDLLALAPHEHLLDIGCGNGQPAVRVARRSGGRVTGITVSRSQLDRATEAARSAGLADRVSFRYGNVLALDFEDGSFDAAMAIEVFAHLDDRQRAFHETARVLRPGGHFLLSEFTLRGSPTEAETAAFQRTWYCAPPTTPAKVLEMADAAGLELVKVENMTQNCSFSGDLMGLLYAERHDEILDRYGPELVAEMDEVMPLVRSYTRDHLGYYLFLLRKPA
ncbi:SAM-dependent methyltransferase [Saccharothrix australiensis]|uniref:Methyltransferase family protein n=1 Tax=Saccharothrix australiensis TaxID=2072 RepID=A0A495VUA7_9PSEU|nr:methyltransferase domain-containing protein [Saccharothrix australiensis]RKT52053.1 methyltransferase family protein [Saccharothrix australiensis]